MTEQIKKSRIVLIIAGIEVLIGIFVFFGIAIMAMKHSMLDFLSTFIALFISILFLAAGVLLWRYHRTGWILSIIIQALCIPQISHPGFSWYIQMPIHLTPKISRGDSFFGVNILAVIFVVVLIKTWRHHELYAGVVRENSNIIRT